MCQVYVKYMRHPQNRDKQKFTLYMDNCSAQNKNWTIYTSMVDEVNRAGGPEEIVFCYFEKGHTFMSADAFHHQVEKNMRSENNIYDDKDFKACIGKSGTSAVMDPYPSDFIEYENGVSQGRYTSKPLLSEVQQVKFVRGSTSIFWKKSMDNVDYEEGIFLKKKLAHRMIQQRDTEVFPRRSMARGVSSQKKDGILKNLVRFMPQNRQQFWKNLPVDNTVCDLIDDE